MLMKDTSLLVLQNYQKGFIVKNISEKIQVLILPLIIHILKWVVPVSIKWDYIIPGKCCIIYFSLLLALLLLFVLMYWFSLTTFTRILDFSFCFEHSALFYLFHLPTAFHSPSNSILLGTPALSCNDLLNQSFCCSAVHHKSLIWTV